MPTLCMILTSILWGATYIFIKIALKDLHPVTFIFFRFLAASLCALPSLGFFKPTFKRVDVVRGINLGLLLGGVTFFQTLGLQTVSASVSAFLTGFAVVFVLAIKLLLQKKLPSIVDLTASVVCIAGLGLVTGSHGVTWAPGVWYTLVCALFVALHTYALSSYAATSNILILTLLQLVVLAIISGGLAFALDSNFHLPTQPNLWGAILICAVFCTLFAFGIQAYAQQYLTAFRASIILMLEPVSATLLACLFLDELLQSQFYVGAFMILGAILLMNLRLERI